MNSDRNPRAVLLALLLLVPFAAACGGAAEEPAAEAPEAPAAEAPAEQAPAPEAAPAEEPMPAEPAEPEIVGNIILSGEDFSWGDVDGDTQNYTWTARVQNDTTSTLDITVRFQFLDDADQVLITRTATITLAPASGRTINQNGTMSYQDEALKVAGFLADYDYSIAG